MKKMQFVVIGLGRFGGSLTRTLLLLGHEVLAIDANLKRVQEFSAIMTHVYQGDCTDEQVLKDLGVRNFDHAIVAIGSDLQASILTTLILKDLGIPEITAKATSEYHSRVLEKIGANRIIQPEIESGIRAAKQLTSKNLIDYIELSQEYRLAEIKAPDSMDGRSLKQLDIRAKFGCNVIAIKQSSGINISPQAEDVIYSGNVIVIIGTNKDMSRFEEKFDL